MSDKLLASAIARLERLKLAEAFDPFHLDSRPTAQQIDIFKGISDVQFRYVRAGNRSGKSQLAARELTWILQDEHPYWNRPKAWGTAPITALVVGKSRQGIETELWANKIRPFLYDSWKEIRSGNVLQSVENTNTGDKVIFLTHADSSDRVIDNLQMYTAHYVWLDEMPRKLRVLEELQNRVSTTKGPFIATFTPKVVNMEVKNFVDAARPPVGKRYPLHRLDNPVFADSKNIELQKLDGLPSALKKAILEGEWMVGAEAVFEVDQDNLVSDLPSHYNKGWRHVESVDPGSKSTGYTLWAEDPVDDTWYCIHADYIEEVRDPAKLFQVVESYSRGYNIVRRVCDPAATWYIGHAASHRVNYVWPYAKNQNRNAELIKNLQSRMTEGKIKLTRNCQSLLEELNSAMWNESGEKIVNHHRFHTIDCAKYFVDCMPKPNKTQIAMTPHQYIYEENEKRKRAVAAKEKQKEAKLLRRRRSVWR